MGEMSMLATRVTLLDSTDKERNVIRRLFFYKQEASSTSIIVDSIFVSCDLTKPNESNDGGKREKHQEVECEVRVVLDVGDHLSTNQGRVLRQVTNESSPRPPSCGT